jgi:hypothetical protein
MNKLAVGFGLVLALANPASAGSTWYDGGHCSPFAGEPHACWPGDCTVTTSPAEEYGSGFGATLVDRGDDGVEVTKSEPGDGDYSYIYFRGKDKCEAYVAAMKKEIDDEQKRIDQYK